MGSYSQLSTANMELTPMQVFWSPHASRKTATITSGTPGVINVAAHGYSDGDRIVFSVSGGALPTEVIQFKPYVVASSTAGDFEITEVGSSTPIDISTSGTGTITVQKELDLGGTLDNVVIAPKYTKADIKADQSGGTVRDRRVSGVDLTIKTSLVEIRDKDTWKVAFPNLTQQTSGGDAVLFESNIGQKDSDLSGFLRLHPLSEDANVLSYDFFVFQAVASSDSSVTYGPTAQAKLPVTWMMLPDDTVTPNRFFKHGDLAAS